MELGPSYPAGGSCCVPPPEKECCTCCVAGAPRANRRLAGGRCLSLSPGAEEQPEDEVVSPLSLWTHCVAGAPRANGRLADGRCLSLSSGADEGWKDGIRLSVATLNSKCFERKSK